MKNVIKHKSFLGSVGFSAEDEIFFGKIEGIDDLVTFEGKSVDELKESFEEAVEDYLAICKSLGKNPSKSYKGSFNVRINPELHKNAAQEAVKKGYSLNQLVEKALDTYLVSEPDTGE